VGQFYEDFQPVSEERVRELLAAAQPSVEQPA
jgi:predicted phosphoribosyltransferase